MDQVLARAVFLPRLSATLLALFAGAALLLAGLGIYGMLSNAVSQRTREIGVRMAGGRRTVELILRDSLMMLLAGVAVGLVAAALLARTMGAVLYGISPFDLPAFLVAALVLVGAGVAATLLPALRATRVDPMIALREP